MSQLPPSPLDVLAPDECGCFSAADAICVCPATERALRHVARAGAPMTAEQREWCLMEIDGVEGYRRDDYVNESDPDVAHGVLNAWTDYCRDKGLI